MEGAEGAETGVDSQHFVPKRRIWPALLVFGALLAGAAGYGVWLWRRPAPLRVLVAVDLDGTWWEGSEPAAVLADRVAEHLTKLGFEPVRGGDPEVAAVLEKASSPEDAARALRAAFLVTSVLTPQVIEHPVKGRPAGATPEAPGAQPQGKGYVELRAEGPIAVRHLDDDGAPEQGTISSWSGAPEKPEAMRLLARSLATMAVDEVVPRLLEHPTVKSVLESSDIKRLAQLQPAKDYVKYRKQRLAQATEAYDAFGQQRRGQEQGAGKVTYHSAPGAADTLGTVGPAGALVKTADVTPFISPGSLDLNYNVRMETVVWRAPDGTEKPLWTGYHVFSQPSAAPEGAPVLFVEDLFGWAKTLTVVGADGKARRLRVDPEHRFVGPEVAPGGKLAALYDRACRECAGDLLVVSLDDGSERYLLPLDGGEFHGFAWLGPSLLAHLYRPAPPPEGGDAPRQALSIVDLGKTPPAIVRKIEVPRGETWANPSASADGRRLALVQFGEGLPRLATVEVETGKLTAHDPGGRADEPALSPDGTRIAFNREGDIALLTVATGETLALTSNRFPERSPRFSPDGKRVYFQSLGQDPNYPRRQVALIASVEVP
ncbi:Hypothetical protein CAP_1059 [Chondromyces apiculatus DSM 436]|uniref:TolB protein n=1 Tax=Chondromyces apiculatus DSM 436 TaxID=1192034 RepID=A0A017STW9_9BACT|nr:Hypothetical protein CAP_1059 [Chondromyces apiculatus DSM 436]